MVERVQELAGQLDDAADHEDDQVDLVVFGEASFELGFVEVGGDLLFDEA